jgi:hypothetical protein
MKKTFIYIVVCGLLLIIFAAMILIPSKPNGLVKKEKMLIESTFSDCTLEINTRLYTLAAPGSKVFWTDLSEDELINRILTDNVGASIKMSIETSTENSRYLISYGQGLFEIIPYGMDKAIRKNRYLITDLAVPLMSKSGEAPTTIMFPRFLLDAADLEFLQVRFNEYYPVIIGIETIDELSHLLQLIYSESNWANITELNANSISIESPRGSFVISITENGKSLSMGYILS